VLTAPDAAALTALLERGQARGLTVTAFREPDLGDELTALAFAPSAETRRLLSNLPLCGRGLTAETEARARARESRLREMSFAMMDTEQTKGQDVLAHGRSVREHYFALLEHLAGTRDLNAYENWRIPGWVNTHSARLPAALPSRHVMDRYLTLHDCGKPRVLTVTEDGRRQFPGHAAASEATYRQTFADEADETVAALIAGDMDIHLLRADEVPAFIARPTAVAHLLAGLAELTSNAAMFGGTDSPSFKGKYKRLDQRGRAICRALYGEV
jgi:hypothetical protein